MAVNTETTIPTFCKNCTHRFVCNDLQANIRQQDADVTKFNSDNVSSKQSVSSINYICRYKAIDPTV